MNEQNDSNRHQTVIVTWMAGNPHPHIQTWLSVETDDTYSKKVTGFLLPYEAFWGEQGRYPSWSHNLSKERRK
jgi:hypothetical protein